ncbi:hypothetical protein ZWY2020_001851 [Hordeum vulgare]|nr:hypothetical protein ZWY2020_001851 [Hordeum vulgare]
MDAEVHVLVFPWPRQGHINPMLQFATALVDAGVQVTFLHTEHNLRRLAQASPPHLRLLSIPDGLPDDHPRGFLDFMEAMCTTGSTAYHALLLSLVSASDAPVTCVVADGTMPFAIEIPQELGIPALSFVTHSACSYLALLSMPKLVELGETPFTADDLVSSVPGMEGFLRRRDLPRGLYCTDQGDGDPLVLKFAEVIGRTSKACALIFNTAASMERPVLAHLASGTSDVFAALLPTLADRAVVDALRETEAAAQRKRKRSGTGLQLLDITGRGEKDIRRVRGNPRNTNTNASVGVAQRPAVLVTSGQLRNLDPQLQAPPLLLANTLIAAFSRAALARLAIPLLRHILVAVKLRQ